MGPSPSAPSHSTAVNHLLLGKSALLPPRGRRRGPPPGSVPAPLRRIHPPPPPPVAREPPTPPPPPLSPEESGETLLWRDAKRRQGKGRRDSESGPATLSPLNEVEDVKQVLQEVVNDEDKEDFDETDEIKWDESKGIQHHQRSRTYSSDSGSSSTELCDEDAARLSDLDSSGEGLSPIPTGVAEEDNTRVYSPPKSPLPGEEPPPLSVEESAACGILWESVGMEQNTSKEGRLSSSTMTPGLDDEPFSPQGTTTFKLPDHFLSLSPTTSVCLTPISSPLLDPVLQGESHKSLQSDSLEGSPHQLTSSSSTTTSSASEPSPSTTSSPGPMVSSPSSPNSSPSVSTSDVVPQVPTDDCSHDATFQPPTTEDHNVVMLPEETSPDSKQNDSSWLDSYAVRSEDTTQSPVGIDSLLLKWPHLDPKRWESTGNDTVSEGEGKSPILLSPSHATTLASLDISPMQALTTTQPIFTSSSYPPLLPSTSINLPLLQSSSTTPPLIPSPVTPQFLPLSSTPPPLLPLSSTPPPLLPLSSTSPPLLPLSSTPPPLTSSSTPPPILSSSSTPPPLFPSSSTPPPLLRSLSTPPLLFQSLSTPPPILPSSSTPPPLFTSSSTPPPFLPSLSAPQPLLPSLSNHSHPPPSPDPTSAPPPKQILQFSNNPFTPSSVTLQSSNPAPLIKPFSLPSLPLHPAFPLTCDTDSGIAVKARDRTSLSLTWNWLPEESNIHKKTKSGSSPSSLLGSPDGPMTRTLAESHLPSSPPKISPNLAPRRHSERALRIIQENSEILQRMLRNPPPSSPPSPTASFPALPERFHLLEGEVHRSLSLEGGERSPRSPASPASSSWPLDTSTDVSASASSKSPATSPVALGDVISWGVRRGTFTAAAGGKLPSPPITSPPQPFNPFPQRASWRQPKELGVKLGLYSSASSPSPPVAPTKPSPSTPTSPSRSSAAHPKQTFK